MKVKVLTPSTTAALLAGLFVSIVAVTPIRGATDTWSGGGAPDGNWLNGANWGGTAPLGSDLLVFSTGNQLLSTNNFAAGTMFNNILFDTTAGAFNLSGSSLTLTSTVAIADGFAWNGSITNSSANPQTNFIPLTIAPGNHYISATNAGKLYLNGAITRNTGAFMQFTTNINVGGSGFTTNGFNNILGGWAVIAMGANAGNWATLDANSNVIAYAGYTTVSSGTTISSSNAANIKITTGATYSLTNSATTNFSVNTILWNVNTAGGIQVGAGTNLILGQSGSIANFDGGTGSGGPYNCGNKVVTIGPTTVNGAGTITAGTTVSGGEITLLDSSFFAGNNDLLIYPSITDNAAGGKVTVTSVGYLVLESSSSYSGGTYVDQGRLTISGANAVGYGPVYVYPGGQLFNGSLTNACYVAGVGTTESVNAGFGVFRSVNLSGPLTLMSDSAFGRGSLTGQITGPGSLIVGAGKTSSGAGTVTVGSLVGPNNYTGDTVVNFPTNADYTPVSPNTLLMSAGANNVMPHGAGYGNVVLNGISGSSWPTWDLNGTVQTINGLYAIGADSANSFVQNSGSGTGTLVVGADNSSPTFGGVLQDAGGGAPNTNLALVKIGTGTFTLTAGQNANSYHGNTTISNGVLALSGTVGIGNSAQIIVKSPAKFDVSQLSSTFTLNAGQTLGGSGVVTGDVIAASSSIISPGASTLSFSNGLTMNATVTNLFTLSPTTNGVNGRINVAGALTLSGNNTIQISYTTLQNGTYRLITYGSEPNGNSTGNWTLAGFAASGTRQTANIVDTGTEIDLQITGSAANLIWVGDNSLNNWDTSSMNWLNGLSADKFYNNDLVTFTDSGSKSPAVSLAANLQPASLLVSNNTGTYTFGGSGNLTGIAALVKQGTGTLILTETGDTLSGGIAVSNGAVTIDNDSSGITGGATIANGATLNLGNSDGNGVLPSGTVSMNGSLNITRNNSETVASTIAGASTGAMTVNPGNSSAVVTLSGANSFDGTVTVVSGTLQISNNAALGSTNGSTTINGGAALDVYAHNVGGEPVLASGLGVDSGAVNGAIFNSGAAVFPAIARLTLLGDTTIGGTGRWDLRSPNTGDSTGASLVTGTGNAYKLTKVGTNQVSIVGVNVDTNLGDIDIKSGTLSIESATTGAGDPSHTLTVEYGANLTVYQMTNLLNKNFVLYGYGITNVVGNGLVGTLNNRSGNNTIIGPMNLNGDVEITFRTDTGAAVQPGTLILSNTISGTGMLGKNDTNLLVLNGTNTYTGVTYIANGTLALRAKGSIGASPLIIVSNGATLDFSGLAMPFSGSNTIVLVGGTNTLGNTLVTNFSTLIMSNATLQISVTNPGVANMVVTNLSDGDVTVPNVINITSLPTSLANAQIPLIKYVNFSGDNNIGIGTMPAGAAGYISNNVPNSSIDLVVTALPIAIWNGGSATDNNWTDGANWGGINVGANDVLIFGGNNRLNNTNDTPDDTTYSNMVFNAGSGAFILNGAPIILNGNVTNSSSNPQTIELGLNYPASHTLNGGSSGLIVGGGLTNTAVGIPGVTLTLAGTGTLTNWLNNAGSTNVIALTSSSAAWTLVDNPSAAAISLSGSSFNLTSGSTFNFGTANSAPNLTITSGSGTDNQIGNTTGSASTFNMVNGTLTLPVRVNTVTGNGTVNVLGGTLNVANQIQIANSALTDNGNFNVSGGTLTVNNGGGIFYVASRGTGTVTLSGTGLIQCGRVDVSRSINNGTAGTFNLNGGTLLCSSITTASANQTVPSDLSTATFNFNGGTLKPSGNSGAFITDSTGNTAVVPISVIVKSGGAFIDANGHNVAILRALQHDSSLGGTADGGLTVTNSTGTGAVTNGAAATYTGNTLITAGTLALSDSGSMNSSPIINIASGAVLDVTGRTDGTLNLASGQTLAGNGMVSGNVLEDAAAAIAPGNSIGVLTVTGTATLPGVTKMEVDPELVNSTNDQIIASSFSFANGTLRVQKVGSGTFAAGQTFKLFSAPSYPATSFNLIQLPALSGGLFWQTNLTVDGTISVVGAGPTTNATIFGAMQLGTNIIIHGTNNNVPNTSFHYVVLTSTDVTAPLATWNPLVTNPFAPDGTFTFTNTIDPTKPKLFYDVKAVP